MKSTQEIQALIDQACGTGYYYRFSIFRNAPVVTDGVIALAHAAECFWLLDLINSYQSNKRLDKDFQFWELKVNPKDHSAVVHGCNDTHQRIITRRMNYTTFPLAYLKLYLCNGVIMLPGEY